MFRAYDIRTPSERLTDLLAARLARAEAVYFAEDVGVEGVVVGRDARATGRRYLDILVEALLGAGLEVVYLPGVSSTSYFYYAAMRHAEYGAIMVGASHNPAGDTGQKLLSPGVRPIARGIGPLGGLDRIRQLYEEAARCDPVRRGDFRYSELLADYIDYSMRLAGIEPGSLRGMRVMHDYLFGAAGREMMIAFARAGAALTPLHHRPDGSFPLGDPNPVKQKVIAPGLQRLAEGRFDLASIFDGDGDRLDIYNGDGTYVSSSFVYVAVLGEIRHRFPSEGSGVLADLKSNPLAVMEMARHGVAVDVVRNGHSQIKQSLYDDTTRFGAVEESAHFYEAFALEEGQRFCTENTLYMALLATRIWKEQPERVRELLDIQGSTTRAREWGYKFGSDSERDAALDAVRRHFESAGAKCLETMRNGMPLEATLMRRGVPFEVAANTRPDADWLQVCQRVSHSEDGLARWEVVGANEALVREAKAAIAKCVQGFAASTEYQG
jgi:phosphomannomutase